MRDDPVAILAKMVQCGFPKKYIWVLKYMCLLTFFHIESSTVIGGVLLIKEEVNVNTILQYLMSHCLLQPGCVGLFFGVQYLTKMHDILKSLQHISSELYLQDAAFEETIKSKARKHKIVSVLILLLAISNHLLYTPFLINDGFTDVSYFVFKRHYNLSDTLSIGVYLFCLLAGGIAIACPLIFFLYFTFHIQFQFSWLHHYVDHNLNDKINERDMININFQAIIYQHLKEIVQYRQECRRGFNIVEPLQITGITLLGITGLITSVSSLSFIICEVNPAANPKIILTIATIVIMYVFFCISCQSILDESTTLNDLLYECPWYFWNIKNRKALLIMLPNLVVPWEISLEGLFSIDRPAITQATNLVYSLVAIAAKFK